MRQIKFRAWNKNQKLMWPVAAISLIKKTVFVSHPVVGEMDLDFTDIAIMQFTGLKDKNNKEIYEGDLFHCIYEKDGHKDHTYEIVYSESAAIFYPKPHGVKCSQTEVVQTVRDMTQQEIIGNIYENPNLI